MKLLKEKYKTYEGAYRRAAFENGLARGEYKRGDKAKLYHYRAVSHLSDGSSVDEYRVERIVVQEKGRSL